MDRDELRTPAPCPATPFVQQSGESKSQPAAAAGQTLAQFDQLFSIDEELQQAQQEQQPKPPVPAQHLCPPPPPPKPQHLLLQQQQQQIVIAQPGNVPPLPAPANPSNKKRQRTELENMQLAAAQLRKEKIARFVAKRPLRKYNRKGETRYEIRKDFASSRKRIKGRFVAKCAPRIEFVWKRKEGISVPTGPLINWDRETAISVKSRKEDKEAAPATAAEEVQIVEAPPAKTEQPVVAVTE